MGDRTWMNMYFLSSEREEIEEIFEEFEEEEFGEGSSQVFGVQTDVESGGYSNVQIASKKKLTFHGSHGEGDNYGALAFASWKGRYAECPVNKEGSTVARIGPSGNLDLSDTKEIKEYYLVLQLISIEVEKEDMKVRLEGLKKAINASTDTQAKKTLFFQAIKDANRLDQIPGFTANNELRAGHEPGTVVPSPIYKDEAEEIAERMKNING